MAKRVPTRRELLDRWRGIEEEDDDENASSSDLTRRRRLCQLKEEWFSDAFNFLIYLPKDNHICCGYWNLMGPLLETFYNYYKDERRDSPLKVLWERISGEMRQCTQCICQHHQAQEMYNAEYESSTIGPLLDVLQCLDEERITKILKEINSKRLQGQYDPGRDNADVMSIMFEVLMFPHLLDDQFLVNEFEVFIEGIDNSHELTLAGHQQYPGVYALLFLKSRRARSIGLRLAAHVGKLRRATDLEPLQPLLKKCIGFLEAEVLSSPSETSRPRVQLERMTVWLGIKSLLGFLDPPAFEEGILDRYPIFLSIVLNHISDDSLEFSFAVNCLRLLFEMLGCKLWLRTTLSPSVMRNTLLGQCFHTRNEKIHKEIFDLFQPFLQSLEPLQDGEHEKQRRHLLYFLLHQVTVSSNFSSLMRKKACQIALLIVHRGYKMNPPCPPVECAHVWGPCLLSSLKDSSLHSPFRQSAFDLIQTIIVSDAAALMTSILNSHTPLNSERSMLSELNDEDDIGSVTFGLDVEEKDISCWNEFTTQSKTLSQEYGSWMCIPMLWFDVLVEADPSVLPASFSKAVLWALSHLSIAELENSEEMALPVRDWLTKYVEDISYLFGWKIPTGYDDGGDGKESKNSIKISTSPIPLVKTFKRLTAHFSVKMEKGELWKSWSWEPSMGESLILLLFDFNDSARQVGKRILEHVSNTQGLIAGLQFLCSKSSSLAAILLGLRHALKLVLLDSVISRFHTLHNFFFVLCKLLKEGFVFTQFLPGKSSDDSNSLKFSVQGGFLRQPNFDFLPNNIAGHFSSVNSSSWKQFSCLLSEIAWPSIKKCVSKGNAFIDNPLAQMTCIRLLEVLPVVHERRLWNSSMKVKNMTDFKWFYDLMDWGKSSLKVVVRYWKQTVVSLLRMINESCSDKVAAQTRVIEELILCDNVAMDELTKQVAKLSVSLSGHGSHTSEKVSMESKSLFSEDSSLNFKCLVQDADAISLEDPDMHILGQTVFIESERSNIIILSDDEIETTNSVNNCSGLHDDSNQCMLEDEGAAPAGTRVIQCDLAKKNDSTIGISKNLLDAVHKTVSPSCAGSLSSEQDPEKLEGRLTSSVSKSKDVDSKTKEMISKCQTNDSVPFLPSQNKSQLKNSSEENVNLKKLSCKTLISKSSEREGINKVSKANDAVLKELVCDGENDPLEFALKPVRRQQQLVPKSSISIPKRQVIQLGLPMENKYGFVNRLDSVVKRFKPPRLDDWFRPILEIDYFVTVGLASASEEEKPSFKTLKEVPLCFESPDEYVDIFRPLVLEEFKAQLHNSFLDMALSEDMCCGSVSVLSVERVDDFHIVRCLYGESDSAGLKSISENDLILLTRRPLKNSSHDVHMIGKVERREKDNKKRLNILVMRFYLQSGCPRLNRVRKLLVDRSKWHISRIMNITPQLREFQALSSIRDIPLLPTILNPVNHSFGYKPNREDLCKISKPMHQILESSYNDTQIEAISAAVGSLDLKRDFDLSLIQGPPGTGKTRTIVATVSVLLAHAQVNEKKRPRTSSLKSNGTSFANPKTRITESAAIASAWQDAALAKQINNDLERNCKSMSSCTRGRVLVCAQSNAAVDELVSRISSEGLYCSDGGMYKPYLVRVGNSKTVHPNSMPYFIDTLVDHQLAEEAKNVGDAKNDINAESSMALRSNLEKLVDRIRFYEARRANLPDGNMDSKNFLEVEAPKGNGMKETSDAELEATLRKLYAEKRAICTELATAQSRERKANDESKALKHKLRKSILMEAEIVVTTLSGCGGILYVVCSESLISHKFSTVSENTLFDAVVIDEAAQALEPATLIPLQLLKSRATKCIMVGDPKQLPATVLSNTASKYSYQCSMFERLQRAGHPVIMLTKQYRMHPEISQFPSLHFYDGKLLNGEQMSNKEAPFHEMECLGPYVFFDIIDGQELHGKNSGALSLYNECEADAAVQILGLFRKRYPLEFASRKIGLITPYKCQHSLLRSRFSSAFGSSITAEMEFNTVDGFQGREVDILVLSTVRAAEALSEPPRNSSSSIGFVADARRMNVALTRAKISLWILGNARTLRTNQNWAALIKDAKHRNLVVPLKKPYDSIFNSPLKRRSISENLANVSRQLKHVEKVKETGRNPKLQSKDAKHKDKKRRETNSIGSQSDGIRDQEHVCRMSTEVAKVNKKRARDQLKKDHTTIVENDDDKTAVDMKSAIGSGRDYGSSERKGGQKQLNIGNSDLCEENKKSSDVDPSKQLKGGSDMVQKLISSRGHREPLEHNRRLQKSKNSTPSSGGSLREGDHCSGKAMNQADTPKDAIAKRKQQRDAVDALLSTALISSKKLEISSKSLPVKRAISPTSTSSYVIKQPKPKRVPEGSSSSVHDRLHRNHHNR